MEKRFDSLNEVIAKKIDEANECAIEKILRGLAGSVAWQGIVDHKVSDRSGLPGSAVLLKCVTHLTEKERGTVPLLQWFLLSTVVSLSSAQDNARSWVGEEVHRRLGDYLPSITGSSGFSCLFFAVANTDGKEKYQSPIGKFWTFMLRSAMVSILIHAKRNLFSPRSPMLRKPSSAYRRGCQISGQGKKTTEVVNFFVDKAETRAEVSASERSVDSSENARKRR